MNTSGLRADPRFKFIDPGTNSNHGGKINEYLDNFVRRPADRMAGRFHGFPCRRRIDSLVAGVRSDFTDFAFRARAARRVRADGHSISARVRCSGTRRTDRSQFKLPGRWPRRIEREE